MILQTDINLFKHSNNLFFNNTTLRSDISNTFILGKTDMEGSIPYKIISSKSWRDIIMMYVVSYFLKLLINFFIIIKSKTNLIKSQQKDLFIHFD